ncbi:hypothetical protein [Algicola sagamiensis]|uniref:hypothetical protein n=1 Tax=Algicola sagamiensis TaxID=163869 RepID=UPI0003A51D18|nr:hypothetical protein [Algicola sagamiensis]
MNDSIRFLLHTIALLVVVCLIGWGLNSQGYQLFTTPGFLIAALYLLLLHWKNKAARMITLIYTAMMAVNLIGSWAFASSIYSALIYGVVFDLVVRWLFLHYDVVASWFKYELPKGSNFFQVFAIGRIYLASATYNILLLLALIPYSYFEYQAPAKFLHEWLVPLKILLSVFIYLNIWSLLFDANSLKKLHQSTRENVA